MNKYKLTYLALISVLSAGFANLHAQESEVFELEDYEVVGKYLQTDQINALKTPTPIENIPQSVTILTSDLMELQDLTSISGIADYVPGVIAGQGEGHRDDILFRGQKSTADFFVDGVRDDVQYYRPLYNVEQVEVLKGANALFFGRGGTGGLINRVSKKALIGEDFTEYALSFDDLGERSIQLDSNMAIAPNMALRLNYYTEDLKNHRNFYYGNNSGINPTLTYEVSDKTTVTASYENLDHERFIDRGITTDANKDPIESLVGTTFADKDFNKSTLDADILKLTVDHRLDDKTKLRINYTDNDFSKLYQNWYASGSSQASPAVYGDDPSTQSVTETNFLVSGIPDGSVKMSGYQDTTQRKSKILSADLIGEKEINGLAHKYVIGIETIDTTNNNDRNRPSGSKTVAISALDSLTVDYPMGPSNPSTDKSKASLDVTSIYFSDEIAITDELDLIIGGRLDDFELTAAQYTPGTETLLEDPVPSRKDEEFSPRIGLVYKPESDLTLYASYSESFIPQSGEQYATLSGNKDKLVSDIYENVEIGAKFDLDNGISVTAALYELTANEAVYVSDTEHTRDEIEYKGFELQAVGNVTDKWFITAGASFASNADTLTEVPSRTFSIWNLYKFDNKLSLGLGIVDKGETIGKGSTNLPAYTRIDAAAYYKIDDNMRLQLNVENVTDELYYPHSYGTHQVSVGAPMHATIKIVGRF
jgi:catecholate siderophore receptor